MLLDLHMHTGYSFDAAPHTVAEKIERYLARGFSIVAVTDHLDYFYHQPPTEIDFEGDLRDTRAAAQVYGDQITVLAGIELGEIHADTAADNFLQAHDLDLVIGSLHSMPNDLDIYFHDYKTMDCDAFLRDYFDELLKMVQHGGFDVLGHIDYPLRVMQHDAYYPSFDQYMDRVSAVLREIIDRGIALESNARGLSSWQKKVGPPEAVLREYRRMGGERVTVGSDSHDLETAGEGIPECMALLRQAGFDRVTYFKNRKAEWVAL